MPIVVRPDLPCSKCGVRARYRGSWCNECLTPMWKARNKERWQKIKAEQPNGKWGPKFGDPLAFELTPRELERFWKFVQKTDDCWLWTGPLRNGAGSFYLRDKERQAHRVSLRVHGTDLIPGLVVDHICKNRTCVHPNHLRQVTQKFNSTINSDSPHARNATRDKCVHGHPFAGENLALIPYRHAKSRKLVAARICLTCTPSRWRYAVIERKPPANSKLTWCGPFRPN